MSKFLVKQVRKLIDDEGQMTISLSVACDSKYAANLTCEEVKQVLLNNKDAKFQVELKPYKSKRSLEQNNLLWALLGKLAEATSGKNTKTSTEECYMAMIEEANITCEYLAALPSSEPFLRESFRVVKKVGEREVGGKTLNMYQCYIGSSRFDTKEMTLLIETVLDRLAELGITDSEIEIARSEYR